MGREQGNSAYASRDCKETTPAGNPVISTPNDHIQLAENLSYMGHWGCLPMGKVITAGGRAMICGQHTGISRAAGMQLNTREWQPLRKEIPQPSRQHSPSNSLLFFFFDSLAFNFSFHASRTAWLLSFWGHLIAHDLEGYQPPLLHVSLEVCSVCVHACMTVHAHERTHVLWAESQCDSAKMELFGPAQVFKKCL